MFEEHYTELTTAVDEIAERIPTLGSPAPATYRAFAGLSSVEAVEGMPKSKDMVRILLNGLERVVRTCREVLQAAQAGGDGSSTALISDRMRIHEKSA